MTVKELIKELEKQPLDYEVVYQDDDMGRSHIISTVTHEENFEDTYENIFNAVILL